MIKLKIIWKSCRRSQSSSSPPVMSMLCSKEKKRNCTEWSWKGDMWGDDDEKEKEERVYYWIHKRSTCRCARKSTVKMFNTYDLYDRSVYISVHVWLYVWLYVSVYASTFLCVYLSFPLHLHINNGLFLYVWLTYRIDIIQCKERLYGIHVLIEVLRAQWHCGFLRRKTEKSVKRKEERWKRKDECGKMKEERKDNKKERKDKK